MSSHSLYATGFAAPRRDAVLQGSLPALVAIVALSLSIAVLLTVTMNAARAANLF